MEVFFDEKCQAVSSSGAIIDELVNLTAILDEAYCQYIIFSFFAVCIRNYWFDGIFCEIMNLRLLAVF